ncbi:13494_t:CDS:2, partial [Dentiscutata erythropus]
MPKLRIKSKKTKYEEIKKTLVSDEALGHDNVENIDLPSEAILNEETKSFSTASYTSSDEKSQKIIDYATINNYQSFCGPLADDIDVSVDYGMNSSDDEVPVDSEEFDVTEVLVDDVLEDSDELNFTDDVLEDMTIEFEGFNSEY